MATRDEGEKILKELALLRRRIENMEDNRKDLYRKQRKLYVDGDRVGLTAAQMARAMRPDAEKTTTENLAESIRQVLRRSRAGEELDG